MREVSLEELKQIVADSREAVWDMARSVGREPRITLHWTVGYYDTTFDDYHINITGDGEIYLSTDDLSEKLKHTWMANSGNVGISLCCAVDADTNDLGDYPPTEKQIETAAQVIAIVANELWLTIDKAHVATHGEIADDPTVYSAEDLHGPQNGCEKWDLEYLGTPESPSYNPYATNGSRGGDVLRGKANWYRNEWKKTKE